MKTPLLEVYWQPVVLAGYTDKWITLSTGKLRDGYAEVYAFEMDGTFMERMEVDPGDIVAWAKCVETVLIECKQDIQGDLQNEVFTCWTFLVCDRIYINEAIS